MRVCKSKFTPKLDDAEDVDLEIGDIIVVKGRFCLRECVTVKGYCEDAGGMFRGYHASYIELPNIELFVNDKEIIWWEGKPEDKPIIELLSKEDIQLVHDKAKEGRYAKYRS